ncbi:MAG: ribonuclease Z [Candidatus ainarchaeum sp.]|nr:ribonuclease Z [Candidatus ainarchaeum sp.]
MEKIKLTILGNCGSVPQKDKSFSSSIISYFGNNLLFDCPEGTQKQLMKSKISLMKIDNIFISHMHTDHFLGLFGWIITMQLNNRSEPLTIFSPTWGKQKIERMLKEIIKPSFQIIYKEIKKGTIYKNDFFEVKAFPLDHEISCFGFVFKEKDKEGVFDRKKAEKLGIPVGPLYSKLIEGKKIKVNDKIFTKKDVFDYSKRRIGRKITIAMDSRPCKETINNAKNSDILVHESTFLNDELTKAKKTKHSTAKEASEIAKKANVKKLILIHFSARTNNIKEFENEARENFKNSFAPNEFDEFQI